MDPFSRTTFRLILLLRDNIPTRPATPGRHFDLSSCSRTTFRPDLLHRDDISTCPAAPGRHFDLSCCFRTTSRPSCPAALKIHNISVDQTIRSKYSPLQVIHLLKKDIRRVRTLGGVILAHNAAFDLRMLHQTAVATGTAFKYPPNTILCTMNLLSNYWAQSQTPRRTVRLGDAYKYMHGAPELLGKAHTACADAEMAAFIFIEGIRRQWWPMWTRYRGFLQSAN